MWVQVELNINKQSYTTKTESFLDEIYSSSKIGFCRLLLCPTKFVVKIITANFTQQILYIRLASHSFSTRIFCQVK